MVLMTSFGCARQPGFGAPPVLRSDGPAFGVYDPSGDYATDGRVAIQHVFVPWMDSNPANLELEARRAKALGRQFMITLEPWSWQRGVTPHELRSDMFSGAKDATIDEYCRVIGGLDLPTFVRWGHEMENDVGRYPWAGWRPQDYIRAYRHFVERCRRHAPNARYVWSPLGHPWLRNFYPGSAYVDVIGLSVYGFQEYDQIAFGRSRSFLDVYRERVHWVSDYGLPIMIAELGYNGDAVFAQQWAQQALAETRGLPRPIAVVYFNAVEVAPWPKGLGLPDWRVNHNIVP
jgi:beta-mannanase